MKQPSTTDRQVKVRAYLTDETFGYDHWRAAQFSAPDVPSSRYAVLTIFQSEVERDAFLAAPAAETPKEPRSRSIQRREAAMKGEPMPTFSKPGNVPDPPSPVAEAPTEPTKWTYTLRSLAEYLGWGYKSDEATWTFAAERERLLRGAMSLLETHKSDAATAEEAIRDRVAALSSCSTSPPKERCQCGHAKGMHPFGHSENLLFSGGCMLCECNQFAASSVSASLPTQEPK